jgi:hypothetical protein
MLDDVRQLKGKHIKALCCLWLKQNIAASTIQNRLSVLRVFCGWSSVGKAGMVLGSTSGEYVLVGRASRTSISTRDRSWTGKGIDPLAKINEVRAINPRIACQLDLQRVFGLRPLEARRLSPFLCDKGTYLDVSLGTKGKRPRVEAIATAE